MSTFERIDLTPFAHLFGSKWYEDVDGYDEDGFLEHPEPNGEVYSGEYGAHIATVHLRGATDAVVNTPHFLAALRFAYAEIDRLTAELVALREQAPVWVTIQRGDGLGGMDPVTLPEIATPVVVLRPGHESPVIAYRVVMTSLRAGARVRTEVWGVALPDDEYSTADGLLDIRPGDRWTYIPEPK